MRNTPLMIKLSPAFKEAIEKAAATDELDMSKWARKVMAAACGYSLDEDSAIDGRGRPRKYATPQQRNKARAAAQRERVARENAVVAEVMRLNRLSDRAELEAWLVARGVSLDDAPAQVEAR